MSETDEIVIRKNSLPAMADGEVKKFVDDIGFAIDAIRAKRTAFAKCRYEIEMAER